MVKISDLDEQEFKELIESAHKGNFISLDSITLHSTQATLPELEDCLNRLIKKHKNFLLLRKQIKVKTNLTE